jgi:hypothetical protein
MTDCRAADRIRVCKTNVEVGESRLGDDQVSSYGSVISRHRKAAIMALMLAGETGRRSVTTARSAQKEDLRTAALGKREIGGGYGPRGASGKSAPG